MASGITVTGSLTDSQDQILDSARIRREYPPQVARLCERHTLDENTGLSWEEAELNRFTAQSVTETTVLENAQQYADTLQTYTPTVTGLTTIVTDRVYRRLSKKSIAKMGTQVMDAINRKKDLDGLSAIDGFTNSQPGAGTSLASSTIAAAKVNISSNTTEGATGPCRGVLHGFQLHDLLTEMVQPIGSYPVPDGLTEAMYREGFMGKVDNVDLFEDGNIVIDSSADSKGGVFVSMAMLLIQGHGIRKETKRRPELGGGADQMWVYDEYIFGERLSNSSSVFGWEIYSDATAPTV